MISKENILKHLDRLSVPEIIIFDEIDSTNAEAKRLAKSKDYAFVIANSQTNGRGRLGRNFYSPKDNGIYMSILLRPDFLIDESVLITTAASVLVARAIENVTAKAPRIKWVNDLYLNNKKVCGILTEAVYDFKNSKIEHIIIGIGINCFDSDFPDDISEIAGSVMGKDFAVSREKIIAEIIREFQKLGEIVKDKSFISEYKSRSMVLEREIEIVGGETATALDIDQNGGLIVRLKDGEIKTLNSGEISIRLKKED